MAHRNYHPDAVRFLQELRAHIVVAGGVDLNTEILEKWMLKDILLLIYPNGIRLKVSSIQLRLELPRGGRAG